MRIALLSRGLSSLVFAILLLFPACHQSNPTRPLVIMVSFDGFRWDYLDKYASPHLQSIRLQGSSAKSLIPVFPTKTFPNHYSIVTGLYPQRHGVVGNRVFDPGLNRFFSMGFDSDVRDSLWWKGEPIWVSATRSGKSVGIMFWPGSEAEILGYRPEHWRPYNAQLPYEERLKEVFLWLDLPPESRPELILVYFSATDTAGHRYGPDSNQVASAVQKLDETVGQLLQGLRERNLLSTTDLLILSDHGMTELGPSKLIFLDDYLELDRIRLSETSPAAFIWPEPGYEEEAWQRLHGSHPELTVYRRGELPERWHLANSTRTPPIVALANEGWTITSRSRFEETGGRIQAGGHGYDNSLTSMHGIFLAAGPSFRRNFVGESFECVHVHALLSFLLDVHPLTVADSDFQLVARMLSSTNRR